MSPRRLRLMCLALPLLLAGCGGGLYIGFGGVVDDTPPSVSLAVAPSVVAPGGTLQLAAAASDDFGIDEVAFYRIDGSQSVRLGSDGSAPYTWTAIAPDDGRSELLFFARAVDGTGHAADSAVVVVTVSP